MRRGDDRNRRSFTAWVGSRSHRPSTAATVVGGIAAVFTGLWFWLGSAGLHGLTVALFFATIANAFGATYVLWRVMIPEEPWGYGRGLLTGLTIGIVSHVTLGFVWVATFVILSYGSLAVTRPEWLPPNLLPMSLWVSAWGLLLTFGIPIALSIAAGLWLTFCRRRSPDSKEART